MAGLAGRASGLRQVGRAAPPHLRTLARLVRPRHRVAGAHYAHPPSPSRSRQAVRQGQGAASQLGKMMGVDDLHEDYHPGLATCHAAEKCGDIVVANEVELKMIEATGWRMTSPDGALPVRMESAHGKAYTVLQRQPFDHARQSQSVVAQGPGGEVEVFVKAGWGGRYGWGGRAGGCLVHWFGPLVGLTAKSGAIQTAACTTPNASWILPLTF